MSLLLQALQKAAKNREAGTGPVEVPASGSEPPAGESVEPPSAILPAAFAVEEQHESRPVEPELTLAEEDLFEPEEVPNEAAQRFEPFGPAPAPASPADAAAILRAGDAPTASWIDFVRDRPVVAVLIGAVVFGVFYSIYVYLQITHPGILRGEFLSQPLTAKTPPPAPVRPLPAAPKAATTPTTNSNIPSSSASTTNPGMPTPPSSTNTTMSVTAPAQPGNSTASNPEKKAGVPTMAVSPAVVTSPEPGPKVKPVAPPPVLKPTPARVAPQAPRPIARATVIAQGAVEPDPEQAIQPAPRSRTRKGTRTPAVQFPTIEHEISTTPSETAPGTVAPLIKDAYQALQDGKLDQAENMYRNALQSEGQNVDALLGLGAIATQRGQVQQAIGFYERVLEAEPRNPTAQAGLIALIGQADPQMSETRLKQLIAREPSAFLYYSLGNLYATQGQWPAAQQAYYQAFQLQPDNPDYAYNLAVGLEHLNQSKLALTYYRKAIDLSFKKGRANFDQKRVIERIGQLSARFD